jgi:hypothetical protein
VTFFSCQKQPALAGGANLQAPLPWQYQLCLLRTVVRHPNETLKNNSSWPEIWKTKQQLKKKKKTELLLLIFKILVRRISLLTFFFNTLPLENLYLENKVFYPKTYPFLGMC